MTTRFGPTLRLGSLMTVALLAACGPGPSDRDAILEGESLYSQFNEELVTRHFFDDRRGGFFVDVGAYYWKKASTTYYLEQHLGWSGIAIDAQKELASGYEFRPNTRFFVYIVTDHSGGTETLYSAGPIASTKESHLEDMGRAFDRDDIVAAAKTKKQREVQVPTITLDDLLEREGVERIDFLSMDIEQGEPAALRGFDIERFRPELVCIEVFPTTQDEIVEYFFRHGYERIQRYIPIDANWYFTPSEAKKAEWAATDAKG